MILDLAERYPAVAKISKKALLGNLTVFRRQCRAEVIICPAVKANAYGHGVDIVAPVLAGAGVKMFAVANLLEAEELARLVPGKGVLVFGPVEGARSDNSFLEEAVLRGYHLTVADGTGLQAVAEAAAKAGKVGVIHIKVDTGMGRMGALPAEALELVKRIAKQPNLKLEGLYTHLATADEADTSFMMEQISCFENFLAVAKKIAGQVRLIHAANSAATLGLREAHFTMVRPGISTYGYRPSEAMGGVKSPGDLQPIMRVESRIVLVKELPAGHTCGYGRTFRAGRPTRIGIVPIGYEDGYRRVLSNKGLMQVRGKGVPVIGRVSMDQTILDLTDAPEGQAGDTVTVISEHRGDPNSVESLAKLVGTIPYEITCLLGRRVKRVLVEEF